MSKGMLGKLPLSEILGPVCTLLTNLAGEDGERRLEELKRLNRRENPFEPKPKSIGLFNPAAFIGEGWEIVGERKTLPHGFNPAQLRVVATPLRNGESYIIGSEAQKRLAGEPLAGVEAFWRCWNARDTLPTELRGKIILFDGDELRGPGGDRYSLYLYWSDGGWRWGYYWLDRGRNAYCVSALAS